jgi:hypothetical protein
MNRYTAITERIASKLAAKTLTAADGLSISTHPDWDFGVLYYTASQQISGQSAMTLANSLDSAMDKMKSASMKMKSRNPRASLEFDQQIMVNSITRTEFTLSLQFSKNAGAEIAM